jgi:hypothetical protein
MKDEDGCPRSLYFYPTMHHRTDPRLGSASSSLRGRWNRCIVYNAKRISVLLYDLLAARFRRLAWSTRYCIANAF